MCGRFFLRPDTAELLALFDALADEGLDAGGPRWNVAPTQDVVACALDPFGQRRLGTYRWGLVPAWWKEPRLPTFVNARSEEVAGKPAFRASFRATRCLVPASGFYEWKGAKAPKQPFAIALPGGRTFAMAGLWSEWRGGPEPLRSLTVLTNAPHPAVAPIHDRMPVILDAAAWSDWLDPRTPAEALAPLLAPWPGELEIRAVGTGVNDARHTAGDWFTG